MANYRDFNYDQIKRMNEMILEHQRDKEEKLKKIEMMNDKISQDLKEDRGKKEEENRRRIKEELKQELEIERKERERRERKEWLNTHCAICGEFFYKGEDRYLRKSGLFGLNRDYVCKRCAKQPEKENKQAYQKKDIRKLKKELKAELESKMEYQVMMLSKKNIKNTLVYWYKEKINEFSKNLINIKFKGILPLGNRGNKKGLYEVLINKKFRNKEILYPSYDLEFLIKDYLKKNGYQNFILEPYKANLGINSFLKIDFSKIKRKASSKRKV